MRTGLIDVPRHGAFLHASVCVAVSLWCLGDVARADPAPIAARVNGVPIPAEMVDDVVRNVIATRKEPPSSEQIERLTQTALESLIDMELLYQEAQARKIRVSEQEIEAEIARTRSRFPNAAEFDAALKASGLSREGLSQDTRKALMVKRLLATVGETTPPAAAEIERYYREHQDEFARPGEIQLSEIVIRVPPSGSVAERAAALERAQQVLATLRAGEDFAVLARLHSDDEQHATQGGARGFVRATDLPAPVAAAVAALEPGEVSEIIESGDGYRLVTVTAIRPGGAAPLAEVRDQIAARLTKTTRGGGETALVKSLRDRANIELKPK